MPHQWAMKSQEGRIFKIGECTLKHNTDSMVMVNQNQQIHNPAQAIQWKNVFCYNSFKIWNKVTGRNGRISHRYT